MRNSKIIQQEMDQIETVDLLAETFKGISSHHISRLKERVLQSKEFFSDLWSIYIQLRKNPKDRSHHVPEYPDKTLYIVVTAEGGLSGDIDKRLVEWMLESFNPETHDIVVLGHHGVLQLAQREVGILKYYKVPDTDVTQINPTPIINDVMMYGNAEVFYQTYVTLGRQELKSIDLFEAVVDLGAETEAEGEAITRENYIFEPSFVEVINYMESIMMGVALSQAVLESKLAQYASRFNAMSAAHDKAGDIIHDLSRQHQRSRRAESDERTREVINGMRYGR